MLDNVKTDDILFLDIETVPKMANYNLLDTYEQELWEEKKGKYKTEYNPDIIDSIEAKTKSRYNQKKGK